jgi:membrane protease YdiL (CAAX protease family)
MVVARMLFSDLWVLLKKDLLLLWRDRSLFFILLLWLAPFGGLIRSPISDIGSYDSLTASSKHHHSTDVIDWSADAEIDSMPKPAKTHALLPSVIIGLVQGEPFDVGDPRYEFRKISREEGITALQKGSIDLLAEMPTARSLLHASPFRTGQVQLVYDKERERSRRASQMFTERVREMQRIDRNRRIALITDSNEQWVYSTISYHSKTATDEDDKPKSRYSSIAGSLVLAGALVSSLVMLIIVDENTRHTLPMILVCAVDRRVVFLSKLMFCMVPTIGVVGTMLVRIWRALPVKPHDFLSQFEILGTAFGAGMIFVFIFSVLLVASGGRARNNIEALAKVGGPLLLVGFLVALTFTSLVQFTPGLILFPLTNLVLCIGQLITATPNWWMCAAAIVSSSLFAVLLAKNGALAMRTEQGLAGEVAISGSKLDALMLFMIFSSVAVLLYNFVGLPASIVYPSVGSLVSTAVLAVIGAGIFRVEPSTWREVFVGDGGRNRILFSCACALIVAALTSLAFSVSSPMGSVSSEMARIEAVTRGSAAPALLFSFAILRAAVEEIVLRGLLVRTLIADYSPAVIILLMAALGAALHPLADTWILMAVLSAVLTYVRLFSRSTIPCVVLHVAYTACLWLIWNRVVQ